MASVRNHHVVAALKKRSSSSNSSKQTIRPKSAQVLRAEKPIKSQFRYFYDRGDLPLRVSFAGAVRKIQWQVDVTQLDYNHYLPVFFEGLCDVEEPYCFLALQGTLDLVERGGDRSLCCIPQLIIPMKRNLLTKIPCVLSGQMKVLQKLVLNCPYAAEALVPYYRQFLLTFNLFLTQQANGGIDLDNGSSNSSKIVEMITETLYLLEKYGGEDAFVNIKYMIPTYESCLQ